MNDIANAIRRQLEAHPDKPVMLSARQARAVMQYIASEAIANTSKVDRPAINTPKEKP